MKRFFIPSIILLALSLAGFSMGRAFVEDPGGMIYEILIVLSLIIVASIFVLIRLLKAKIKAR